MASLLGVLAGTLAALPLLQALRVTSASQSRLRFGAVVACALVPFLVLQVLLIVVRIQWPDVILAFGSCVAVTYLLTSAAAGLVAWLRMQKED